MLKSSILISIELNKYLNGKYVYKSKELFDLLRKAFQFLARRYKMTGSSSKEGRKCLAPSLVLISMITMIKDLPKPKMPKDMYENCYVRLQYCKVRHLNKLRDTHLLHTTLYLESSEKKAKSKKAKCKIRLKLEMQNAKSKHHK